MKHPLTGTRICALVSVLSLTLATGCKQTQGESCQVNNDCDSGLICCKTSAGATPTDRGICLTETECAEIPDATTDPSTDPADAVDTAEGTDDTAADPDSEDTEADDEVSDSSADSEADTTLDTFSDTSDASDSTDTTGDDTAGDAPEAD